MAQESKHTNMRQSNNVAQKYHSTERKQPDKRSILETRRKPKTLKQTGNFIEDSDEKADPMIKNKLYLTIMMVLLILTTIVVTFMLLPLPNIPKNAHIPVLLWSTTILFSVSFDVESSVHPRIGLGWTILETFLIWITLPMRIRAAFFYTATLASIYLIVTSCRVNNHFHLGRQVIGKHCIFKKTNTHDFHDFADSYLSS
jgi:hypothetical protein